MIVQLQVHRDERTRETEKASSANHLHKISTPLTVASISLASLSLSSTCICVSPASVLSHSSLSLFLSRVNCVQLPPLRLPSTATSSTVSVKQYIFFQHRPTHRAARTCVQIKIGEKKKKRYEEAHVVK